MDNNKKILYLISIMLVVVGIAVAIEINTSLDIDVKENNKQGKIIIYYEPQCVEFYEDEITHNDPKEVKIHVFNVPGDYDIASQTEFFFEASNEQLATFQINDIVEQLYGFNGRINYENIEYKSVRYNEHKEFVLYVYKNEVCEPGRYPINLVIKGNLA